MMTARYTGCGVYVNHSGIGVGEDAAVVFDTLANKWSGGASN